MKSILLILFLFLLNSESFANGRLSFEEIQDEQQLTKMWHDESIYLSPKNPHNPADFSGNLYYYPSKICVKINHNKNKKIRILASKIQCPKKLKKMATEPYKKISDFNQYKGQFQNCLKKQDKQCLRPLISRTLQVSFGMEPLMDRRDVLFKSWTKGNFTTMLSLLQKGTTGSGDRKSFPPTPSDEGTGQRGIFSKKSGYWLLTSYLAGD